MRACTLVALWLLGSVFNHAQASGDCHEIRKMPPETMNSTMARAMHLTMAGPIRSPGKYCLVEDIESLQLSGIGGENKGYGEPILDLGASNVDVDLQGHSLSANTSDMRGVHLFPLEGDDRLTAHVSIRNGTVTSRTGDAINFASFEGSLLSDFLTMLHGDTQSAKAAFNDMQSITLDEYALTEYVIENVKVRANTGGRSNTSSVVGIGMRGRRNVIRNSTIEVTDGHVAIYLFGPGNVIENNTIIFHGQSAFESAAAIKLHQADGTIIRNNDIVIETPPMGKVPAAAIALVNSKGVVIENNRLRGIKAMVKAWDDKSDFAIAGDREK